MMRAAKIADNSVTAVRDGTRIGRLVATTNNTFTIAQNFATFWLMTVVDDPGLLAWSWIVYTYVDIMQKIYRSDQNTCFFLVFRSFVFFKGQLVKQFVIFYVQFSDNTEDWLLPTIAWNSMPQRRAETHYSAGISFSLLSYLKKTPIKCLYTIKKNDIEDAFFSLRHAV